MWPRLRSFATMMFRRSQWERDLRDEFDFHIQERADVLEREGLARPEAIRRARIEFRRMETAKEECREARGARWVDGMSRNLTWALRSVRQHPGFSLVAVISLALGIGANLAVFGVLHRLLLTTLPVRDPASLYHIGVVSTAQTRYAISYTKFQIIADNFEIFTPLFGRTARGRGPKDDGPRSSGGAPVGGVRGARDRVGDDRVVRGDCPLGQQPHARNRHSHRHRRRGSRRDVDDARTGRRGHRAAW